MALFTTLYSGSSGNCGLVLQDGRYLLIDMGKSCRTTLRALKSLGLAVSDCEGILITHEHADHVSGLDTFLKHYSVPVFAGADTLATAYTLSLGVRHLGDFDLILCGRMAIDGDTAQIGPELAEDLGIPQVTNVTAILEAREGELLCAKATDQGAQQVRVKLPALLTVAKDINMPRMASIRGVKQSLQAPLEVLSAADVQADPQRIGLKGSPTQVVRTFTPEKTVECVWLEGDTAQQAGQLAKVLLEKTQRGEDAAWQA